MANSSARGRAGRRFEPVQREPTAALIARSLRDAIAEGHFAPGQQLLESELAGQFEVSRGVLREAMQRLTQEGLLLSRRNRGLFVAELGYEEVFDIYTARTAIERAACLKVIDVSERSDELYRELTRLADELEARADEGADARELASLDIEFHECMVSSAESPRLDRMHETLVTETRMCISSLEAPRYPVQQRIAEHRRIAEAIRDRDGVRLSRHLAEHMDNALRLITQAIEVGEDS